MSWCYINGEYLKENQSFIPVTDLSYQFGMGFFESFVTTEGEVLFLEAHLQRLEWSITFLGYEFPQHDFKTIIKTLHEKCGHQDSRFKIIMSPSRSENPGEEKSQIALHTVVLCQNHDLKAQKTHYRLRTAKHLYNECNPLVSLKSTSYGLKKFARAEAQELGYDDAILINPRGKITECTSANIFWVDKDSKLFTVSKDQGYLTGIFQNELTKLLKEKKLALQEGILTPEELSHSKEVFVTNSVMGIIPVSSVDDRMISGGVIGSITAMIKDLFEQRKQEILAKLKETTNEN